MWYHDKELKFECQTDCSKCCQVEGGEYGHVTFHHSDVSRLDAQQKKEVVWLGRANMNKTQYWEVPITWNRACLFLEEYVDRVNDKADWQKFSKCSIHDKKPVPCAAYPFWPEVMKSEEAWLKEAEFCPGIGKGEVVPARNIDARIDSVRDYPKLER